MIKFFRGEYEFLSNFSRHPIENFPTVEHYFQAHKTNDLMQRARFQNPAISPGQAKRMGRHIKLTKEELKAWNNGSREKIMTQAINLKFAYNTPLSGLLIDTGDHELIEGNTWHDNVWGSCVCATCGDVGMNLLGKTLMARRKHLFIIEG